MIRFLWNKILEFSISTDDQPPNSAISVSGLSTATPPMVVGNRFFGPDFSIEQVKGMHFAWFSIEMNGRIVNEIIEMEFWFP